MGTGIHHILLLFTKLEVKLYQKNYKKYWALLPGLYIISRNYKKLIFGLFLEAFISLGHKCSLVMFGFSKIRCSYVTFKVKVSNGYSCPFIKMLFKVEILTCYNISVGTPSDTEWFDYL